ncbi:MAG: N-6 DNA methylase [Sphingobacteriales bacterium]|nr:MAG: N-6 DNA methylase [Sphingobacteriales bacterium]
MSLFQKSVLNQYLKQLDKTKVENAYQKFKAHFHNATIQQHIRDSKEEQYQGEFLIDLFVNVLGYTKNPQPNFNLQTEQKNETNSKKADGAILKDSNAIAVIELKGTNTTDLATVAPQAFGYKNNQKECKYVIISNFEKLRFYIDNAIDFEEFNLFTLTENEFTLLYLCLHIDNIFSDLPAIIKQKSTVKEQDITKQLYKDYSDFKRKLFTDIVQLNPQYDKLILFKKSQKLLDRILFILFAEDRGLLQANTIQTILDEFENLKKLDAYQPLYERFKKHFTYLNNGLKNEKYEVFGYNGGLFANDEILDTIKISDNLLQNYVPILSKYDYETDVDVNILGHIFEHSLNDIEEIQAELDGTAIDKTKTKRKKDGVFYTPKYITKYIVENTVGALCTEKRNEYGIIADNYTPDKRKAKKKELLQTLDTYQNWLLQITIVDPACGSGAFLNQALDFLIQEHKGIDELRAQLLGHSFVLPDHEIEILENNIFGVDLNDESVEIARLSLWLRTARKGRKLNSLNNNIKCGNSLIDDATIAGEKAFDWQKEFPKIFERGGFDVVIGNPPYVQLQSIKEISESLQGLGYNTFEKTGDLYCMFYEKGNIILKENGILGFITSNKWMRSNYGKSLRKYITEYTQPILIIDLGAGIFDSATVDSNILIFSKNDYKSSFNAIDITNENYFLDFSIYENQKIEINPKKDEIWTIYNLSERNIKQQIEKLGTPLKDWNLKIYLGIKTGYNEAFVIDKQTKEQLIKEDANSIKIIKPILRGKDIKAYITDYSDLWLINFHNGYKVGNEYKERIKIEDYPAIKKHLDKYWNNLENRYDKGETPYNLRNCAYVNEFAKKKIVYPDISQKLSFVILEEDYIVANTAYFLTTDSCYLLSVLNSKLINYYYKSISAQLGSTGIRSFTIYIEQLPIPNISLSDQQPFIEKAETMLQKNKELQTIKSNVVKLLQSQYSTININTKLNNWNELSFKDFCKELEKQKIKLTLSEKAELLQYFETEQTKANNIQQTINQTDKEIDTMVYKLYELTDEEIKIVENN